MNDEILRLVDTIHRAKEIDKEVIFLGIEAALLSAVKKKMGESETTQVTIDRRTGETTVVDGDEIIPIEELGRIAAMTGKQVLFQKIREAERDRIYEEFCEKVGNLVSGVIQRTEGPNLIVNLGKVEGFLPRSEQVPGERFRVGERIKVLVKELRKNTSRVKIILSRTSNELVKRLFELEVPEIADKVIEVMGIAREPGYRTKIAVTTYDRNVDCVGACVGVRGSRIKNIVDELFGEKIDIVRWNESIEVLIMNALQPAEISSMDLDFDRHKAIIYVKPDQQSLAIGKRGQNVRLASKLSGWELDIVTVSDEELEKLRHEELPEEVEQEADKAAEASPDSDAAAGEEAAVEEETGEAESAADRDAPPPEDAAAEGDAPPPEDAAAEGDAPPPEEPPEAASAEESGDAVEEPEPEETSVREEGAAVGDDEPLPRSAEQEGDEPEEERRGDGESSPPRPESAAGEETQSR
ncbi:MAG: transcription termination factor NusA [Planctomycetes bacterium]|nr:transcription termination factor NusA [Planctomycetota bacterium]